MHKSIRTKHALHALVCRKSQLTLVSSLIRFPAVIFAKAIPLRVSCLVGWVRCLEMAPSDVLKSPPGSRRSHDVLLKERWPCRQTPSLSPWVFLGIFVLCCDSWIPTRKINLLRPFLSNLCIGGFFLRRVLLFAERANRQKKEYQLLPMYLDLVHLRLLHT